MIETEIWKEDPEKERKEKKMDDFEPARKSSLGARLAKLEESEKRRRELERERYRLRQTGGRAKAAEIGEELALLQKEQEEGIRAVTRVTEKMMENKAPVLLEDEREQPYNECVGYAYGMAIYAADSDDAVYCCETQEDAVELGETAPAETLRPLSERPRGEQDMVLRYLANAEETPEWFRNRLKERSA